ncbi:unnamed protein product [Caenorhabditis angaria]|uniref:Calcineurin-like phosphoesterase domain-containing protein n=1 Tax=Caenorhabditis angaria TaxID=860376 RepID=A0A9P1N4C4_9PELO|nr:unnamed protein product [Caenorhabditis angaria]
MLLLIIFPVLMLLSKTSANYQVLHLADFHLDLQYSKTGNNQKMCHDDGVKRNSTLGDFGDYMCDAPKPLVQHAIEESARLFPHPDLILWTGDNVPHIDGYQWDYCLDDEYSQNQTIFSSLSYKEMSWAYFGSPDFLKASLHFITIFEIPIHFLGFYFVIFRTPVKMQHVKSSMIQCCIWGVALDVALSFGMVPYLLFPTLSGQPLGILSDLGVTSRSQTILIFELLIGVGCSIIGILENRFACIKKSSNSYKNHFLIYFINGLIGNVFVYLIFTNCPEQKEARRIVLYELLPPNLPSHLYTAPIFVVSLNRFPIVLFMLGEFLGLTIQCLFFVAGTIYRLYFQKAIRIVSQNTKKMQNKFFVLICIQFLVPMIVLTFPMVYIGFSCTTMYYNQALNNLVFILFSLYGVMATISIILVHSAYRKALFSSFMNAKVQRKVAIQLSYVFSNH